VRGQVGEALVDVRRLGPDTAIDERFLMIGQVHEGGKVFAAPDRVNDGAARLAGGQRGPAAHEERLQGEDGAGLAFILGL
jgi:hypothetical protein